jgi:adenylate kinase family enzyme
MRRIVVVGIAGAGKTTFAATLSNRLNIPTVELDALFWEPNWTPTATATFQNRVAQATAGESWIIDGTYTVVREMVWQRADTLIWLDYSMSIVFLRVFRRTLHRLWTSEELWAGNRKRIRDEFFSRNSLFLWVIHHWREYRRDYPKLLRSHTRQGKRIFRFRTPAAANRWLFTAERQ